MRMFLLAILITLLLSGVASAQTGSQTDEGFHRFEGYFGYSHAYLLNSLRDFETITPFNIVKVVKQEQTTRLLKGFEVSGTGNPRRYFGLKFDFSRYEDSRRELAQVRLIPPVVEELPAFLRNNRILGGFQLKDNGTHRRIKPFAHVLVGTNIIKDDEPFHDLGLVNPVTLEPIPLEDYKFRSSFAYLSGAIGGGLDIRISDRLDLRALQIDYHQDNGGQNKTIRVGTGVVFH